MEIDNSTNSVAAEIRPAGSANIRVAKGVMGEFVAGAHALREYFQQGISDAEVNARKASGELLHEAAKILNQLSQKAENSCRLIDPSRESTRKDLGDAVKRGKEKAEQLIESKGATELPHKQKAGITVA